MRLTIESTQELVFHEGQLCRVWLCEQPERTFLVLVAGLVLDDEHPDEAFTREFFGPLQYIGEKVKVEGVGAGAGDESAG